MTGASHFARRGRAVRSGALILALATVALTAIVPAAHAAVSLGDYHDTFPSTTYSGSAGSLAWTGPWVESGDDGVTGTGLLKVASDGACPSGACLVIGKTSVPGAVAKLTRTADLSTAASATLTFDYERHKHGSGSGEVKVQIGDGHKSSTVQTFSLDASDNSTRSVEYDITPWISSATTIRFKVSNSTDDSHMNVDNVRIELFAEENIAPELDSIADATIPEQIFFSFTASASDANIRGDDLAFSLDGTEPSGATISTDGVFVWTPTEAQGPGSYSFDVIVTDDGLPSLSDSQTVTLTVAETNAPPVLAVIGDKSLGEGSLLAFEATATDPDTATTALRFSLTGGPPAGAAITTGGAFTWTPGESHGPGTYTFAITVTDDGLPDGVQSDSETITVTVGETNRAPAVATINNRAIDEGAQLIFTATATDPDLPANDVAFRLSGAPQGASITSAGSFEWTPTETQGPGVYTFSIIATDDGIPARSDSESVTITVEEANIAPLINPIGTKIVGERDLLRFIATAVDSDVPADSFEFGLSGAPAGAAITPGGIFTWRPSEIQGPGTYRFDVVVTDFGIPPQARHVEVTVVVTEINTRPVLAVIPDQYVVEGTGFLRNMTATDIDSPANTLHFSLNGAPAGATITPTGRFEWTPNEAQGPGTYTFDIVVTDDGSPALSDSRRMTIRVAEGNNAPIIDPVGPITTAEGEFVSFTATAVDTDLPTDDFWFSLAGNAPAGARITRSGVFTWTPGEAHGPGTHTFDIVVTDKGTPARSSTRTVTVTVSEVNSPPRLTMADDYLVEAGLPYVLLASAEDTDLPAQALRFTATGLPNGAELSDTGELTWTPSVNTVGDGHVVTITVADSGSPALSDSASFTLTLVRANQAPVLAPIGGKHVELGGMLTFTARAVDSDGPDGALRFSLGEGAPAGASIDPVSGAFRWRPAESQYDARFTVTVTVTDAGSVPKSDSETFDVVVGRENVAPTLTLPSDQLSAPGEGTTLTIQAVDPDGYPEALVYGASNLPPGLTIDEATGVISGTVGFDGLANSPFRVEVSVFDGRVTTSTTFSWRVTGSANRAGATPTRRAIVSGIVDIEPPPAAVQPDDIDVSRSLVIMSRAVRSGVTEMSLPLLLLLFAVGGLIAFGRIGLAPVIRRGTRHEGIVRRYDPDTGSGLVLRSADGAEVFVHASAVVRQDRSSLAPGDHVVFRTIDGAYRDLVTTLQRRR